MNKLKEKFGKYFQFKNTTNGTDYFLRGLATLLFVIPIGLFIGVGVALIKTNALLAGLLVGLGTLGIIPMIWFSLATTYKRINAFFPNKAGWLVACSFIYAIVLEGFNPENAINTLNATAGTLPDGDYTTYFILALPYWGWSLYLLFGNSKVKKHIG